MKQKSIQHNSIQEIPTSQHFLVDPHSFIPSPPSGVFVAPPWTPAPIVLPPFGWPPQQPRLHQVAGAPGNPGSHVRPAGWSQDVTFGFRYGLGFKVKQLSFAKEGGEFLFWNSEKKKR